MLAAGHLKFKIQTTENVGNGLGGQGSVPERAADFLRNDREGKHGGETGRGTVVRQAH